VPPTRECRQAVSLVHDVGRLVEVPDANDHMIDLDVTILAAS
jgi:hypothetical protein